MTPRIYSILAAGAALTAVVVAFGRVPLIVGLVGLLAAGVALLPGGPRRFLLRRLARVAASILVAMALVWFLMFNLPDSPPIRFSGDTSIAGPIRSTTEQEGPRERGLRPAMEAYGSWLGDLAGGELGGWTSYSETVGEGVGRTIPLSMQLLAYSQVIALLIAIPGALVASVRRGKVADLLARATGLLGLSTPVFVIGPILVLLFAVGEFSVFGHEVGFRVLPSGRYAPIGSGLRPHLRSMLLPSLTLGLSTAAFYLVLLRSEINQQLTTDHALLARSKGLSTVRIVRAHALRPAAPSVVAAVAAQSGLIIGSLIIIERIFLLPGFGDYVIIAIIRQDLPAVVGALFVVAVILGVVNLFADALLLIIDPRIGHD